MNGSATAVITVVHGRHQHLDLQEDGLRRSTVGSEFRCLVAIDDPVIAHRAGADCDVIELQNDRANELPLARARNAGARQALRRGADLLIFLDVDCVPDPALIHDYRDAYRRRPDALLCGPVGYLPPPPPGGYRLETLPGLTAPHPVRPVPAPGMLVVGDDYDLFWSLSFAVGAATWARVGGFCERYVGYGGEDTDFAAAARTVGVPLVWVGGAYAYHQFHPVSDPPVEHLAAIVRNARVFRDRWGRWPMGGWLDAFERDGLILRTADDISVLAPRVRQSDAANGQ